MFSLEIFEFAMEPALLSLLSQALVAMTIELDNEFERRMPHSTTTAAHSAHSGPWLTSYAMYANCLQWLEDSPISLRELGARARTSTNVDGMRRWGYIRLMPDPSLPVRKRPDETWLVQLTEAGTLARDTWRPLLAWVEQRWGDRFGTKEVAALRDALLRMNLQLDAAYPDTLPILGYGLYTRGKGPGEERPLPKASERPAPGDTALVALLARLLCAFAYEFERGFPISLAISANMLLVLNESGMRSRDLPQQAGVSKESIQMGFGILQKRGIIVVEKGPGKTVRLTAKGLAVQQAAQNYLALVESRWRERLAADDLRNALEPLVVAKRSLLFEGLDAHAGGWRGLLPKPRVLPGFPMILHRGGYPDGS